jgi:hypothetical protein
VIGWVLIADKTADNNEIRITKCNQTKAKQIYENAEIASFKQVSTPSTMRPA